MAKTRTFIDAGVLIAAARGTHELAERALEVLDDPNRDYVTSDFVRLEVLPKAVFNRKEAEAEFYRTFFDDARRTIKSSSTLVAEAQAEADIRGLSAVDALHVAAAKRAGCAEFLTTEKATKPLFSVSHLTVTSIRSDA
ncbi:MAG: type II toxin-antitoxin system VapC family toxin [Planctomycetota bacterium]